MTLDSALKTAAKTLSYAILGTIVSFSSGCTYREIKGRPGDVPEFVEGAIETKSLGCALVDLELRIGAHPRDHSTLHELAGLIHWRLPLKEKYAHGDRVAVLDKISSELISAGFTNAPAGKPFYSALRSKKATSLDLCCIYLEIAQETKLPLRLALTPKRAMIVWDEDGKHDPFAKEQEDTVWDPVAAKAVTDTELIRSMNVSPANIKNGLYLSTYLKHQEISLAHALRGQELLRTGKYDEAARDFDSALAADSASLFALIGSGRTKLKIGDPNGAIADHDCAVTSYPGVPLAYLARAEALLSFSKYERAIADCTSAIRLDPENASAYFLRAQIRSEQGGTLRDAIDDAIGDLSRSIEFDPTNPAAYIRRGSLFDSRAEVGDKDRARQDYSRYRELTTK